MRHSFALIPLLVRLSLQSAVPKKFSPLKFARDGTFQIAILEDLHFGES